jgi:hypothetical protein
MEPLACVVELVPGYKGGHPGTPVAAGARSRRLISGCMPGKREPKFQRRQQPQTQPLWYQMRIDAVSSRAILYQHPPPKTLNHSGRAARTGDRDWGWMQVLDASSAGAVECPCSKIDCSAHTQASRLIAPGASYRVCAMRLCRSSAGELPFAVAQPGVDLTWR